MIVNPSFTVAKEKYKVPAGGTAGQLLTKKSAADFDAQWQDAPKAEGIPSGLIAMWSGVANKIPSGWVLCNGSNGTPDLRNRFIVGAGSSYSVGATGGSDTVKLNISNMPKHSHTVNFNAQCAKEGSDSKYSYITGIELDGKYGGSSKWSGYQAANSDVSGGESYPHENRPPYYALCFIMKT